MNGMVPVYHSDLVFGPRLMLKFRIFGPTILNLTYSMNEMHHSAVYGMGKLSSAADLMNFWALKCVELRI